METATVDTPTTTPASPAPTSTPAPAATSPAAPASASVERPKSFAEAMERVAAKNDAPEPAPGTAAAIVQPGQADPTGAPATAPGPIPFEQHTQILKNTRAKAAAERDQQWNQTYGWARQIQPEHGPRVLEYYQALEADPVAFYQRLGRDLANHPEFGARFRQIAGGVPSQPQTGSLDPDVTVIDERGQAVGKTFSAERVQAIVQAAVDKAKQELSGQVAPLRDFHDRQIQEQHTREYRQQLETHADTIMGRVDQILGVTKDAQGKPDARSSQLYKQIDQLMEADPNLDVHDAALQVRAQMAPQQMEQAKVAAAEEMRRKAAGNTANGASASASPLARPRNAKELAAWMEARSAQA